ncbi:hypothetical protein NLJ89_g3204 [Agrocybe chaxingu]|uniref:Uncharacterized protein n=1 Tax=Agrocybe chaxingu TaxID=84603 RepID=A0A9W8K5B8_9AGAR|nr:hypothetical protein NLJ89_g3204 [Agrocybe chaxingu]
MDPFSLMAWSSITQNVTAQRAHKSVPGGLTLSVLRLDEPFRERELQSFNDIPQSKNKASAVGSSLAEDPTVSTGSDDDASWTAAPANDSDSDEANSASPISIERRACKDPDVLDLPQLEKLEVKVSKYDVVSILADNFAYPRVCTVTNRENTHLRLLRFFRGSHLHPPLQRLEIHDHQMVPATTIALLCAVAYAIALGVGVFHENDPHQITEMDSVWMSSSQATLAEKGLEPALDENRKRWGDFWYEDLVPELHVSNWSLKHQEMSIRTHVGWGKLPRIF